MTPARTVCGRRLVIGQILSGWFRNQTEDGFAALSLSARTHDAIGVYVLPGVALNMAANLATTPVTGLRVQAFAYESKTGRHARR